MATLHLNVPDEVKALAEARAAESGYTRVEDYVTSLVRADATQDLSEEMEQAVLDGLNSGPAVDVTPRFWTDLKARRTPPATR